MYSKKIYVLLFATIFTYGTMNGLFRNSVRRYFAVSPTNRTSILQMERYIDVLKHIKTDSFKIIEAELAAPDYFGQRAILVTAELKYNVIKDIWGGVPRARAKLWKIKTIIDAILKQYAGFQEVEVILE